MIEIVLFDLRTRSHHECSEDDDRVFAMEAVLFDTILLEELVAETGIEDLLRLFHLLAKISLYSEV